MTNEKTAIGPWLLVPVFIVTALGHGMLNQPYFAVKAMGNNAYWGFPIAAFCFVAPALAAIYLLAKRFPGQSLIEQGKSILGPVLGTITGIGYLMFLLVFLVSLTRDIVNLASLYFLFTTPVYLLALVYLSSAVWLASRGVETVTRTASVVLIPALILILLLTAAAFQNVSLNNLKPVFTPNPLDYLNGAKGAMQTFYMLGLAAMVLPFLKPLHSFPRFAGGTLLLLLIVFMLMAAGCIGTFGPEFLLKFNYPNFEFFRNIDIPYLLLQQTGMIIGITWLVIIMIGSAFGHYALSLGFSHATPFWDYKKWVWVLAPVKYILIILPSGILQTKMLVTLTAQNGWIFFFAYPLILWIIALLMGKKGDQK